MKKVRAAIVGYGNIGHYVLEALQAAPDFEIAGVVRRAGAENKPEELANYAVAKDIKECRQSSGDSPFSRGTNDTPCMSSGTDTPASSRKVGA